MLPRRTASESAPSTAGVVLGERRERASFPLHLQSNDGRRPRRHSARSRSVRIFVGRRLRLPSRRVGPLRRQQIHEHQLPAAHRVAPTSRPRSLQPTPVDRPSRPRRTDDSRRHSVDAAGLNKFRQDAYNALRPATVMGGYAGPQGTRLDVRVGAGSLRDSGRAGYDAHRQAAERGVAL